MADTLILVGTAVQGVGIGVKAQCWGGAALVATPDNGDVIQIEGTSAGRVVPLVIPALRAMPVDPLIALRRT
jgi:hypothetical protein